MTTTKLNDKNRRTHAAKVLAANSKKNKHHSDEGPRDEEVLLQDSFSGDRSLNDQVMVIREDIFKLREDIAHGYDLLKERVEKKINFRSLLRSK